jgi:hypothetical protein
MQLQQSQFILAEKNARRMIENEIDNCIERICGFGTLIGDELVEGALDAAGVGHSLGAIKDQSTMILIALLAKLSKMSVRMSCVPILWEHHGNRQKWRCIQKWKAFSKTSSRATHLYLFQSTRSLRAMKSHVFASWKHYLRINKRLYFMQKEKERKTTHAVFASFAGISAHKARANKTAARLCRTLHLRIIRHIFVCWAIVTKRAMILQKQTLIKAGVQNNSKLTAVSYAQWHLATLQRKNVQKLCCTWNGKLKVLKDMQTYISLSFTLLLSIRNRCFCRGSVFAVTVTSCNFFPMHCKGPHAARNKDMC